MLGWVIIKIFQETCFFVFLLHILNEIDDGNKTKFEGIQVKIKILIIFVTWTGELTY